MKFLLAILFLAAPAYGDVPWLEPKEYGTTAVEVKRGTITVDSITSPVAVTQGGPFTVSLSTDSTSLLVSSFLAVSVSVVVVGGSGESVFDSTGTISSCGIVPPGSETYMFEIVTNDATEYPVFGHNRLMMGRVGLSGHGESMAGSHKAKISSASADGTWKVRCIIKQ